MKNTLNLKMVDNFAMQNTGSTESTPVFVFHGNPNSRLIWGLINDPELLNHIRLTAPDRPGYWRTEFKNKVKDILIKIINI